MHSFTGLPPIAALNAFLEAARLGSFSAAAAALNVTHSTVSRQVALVEDWLGHPVFERKGRGVALTPAGQRFSGEIRTALERIARTADQWNPRRGRPSVRISTTPSFARLWLLPRLRQIEGDPPDLQLDLRLDHRVRKLEPGDIDIAIRYTANPGGGPRFEPFIDETFRPAASVALAAELGPNPDPADLLNHPLIHDSDTAQWRAWFARHGLEYGARQQDRRFEDYDMVVDAGSQGLGIVMLRSILSDADAEAAGIQPLTEQRLDNPKRHFVVFDQTDERPAVLRAVERLLRTGGR